MASVVLLPCYAQNSVKKQPVTLKSHKFLKFNLHVVLHNIEAFIGLLLIYEEKI